MPKKEVAYRFATRSDLGNLLEAYRLCFDPTQRLRTVAHSPLLFRLFHAREMRRGRCNIALAFEGPELIGFCIVREQDGPRAPWLLSAIGVVPAHRKGGVARKLFAMVADRPLVLTVEEEGPVGFYVSLGLRRSGVRTLIYFNRREAEALRNLPVFARGGDPPFTVRTLNRAAFLISCKQLGERGLGAARRRLLFFRCGILEMPDRVEVPAARFRTVVREAEFSMP